MVSKPHRTVTLALWVGLFMNLMTVYFLNSWRRGVYRRPPQQYGATDTAECSFALTGLRRVERSDANMEKYDDD
jgi:hypothetical protein